MSQEKSVELSVFERMLVNCCLCGDYMVMGSTFVENIEDELPLDKDLVRQACVYLQKRHPFLHAYLENHKKENKMYLKIINEDVTDIIELEWLDLSNETVDRKILNEESAIFDSKLFEIGNKQLLWRVQVILYKEDNKLKYLINLVLHIAITDGMNINTLCIELINIINALNSNTECDEMKYKLEPIDDLYEHSKKTNLFKEHHMETIRRLNNDEKVKFVLHEKFRTTNETGFKLDLFKLDKNLTKRITECSKANNIRLSGFFHTVSLYAMKRLYEENDLDFPRRVSVELPASLRVRYQPNMDFANCRLHTVMVMFPTDEKLFGKYENFWKDAQYMHKAIQENTCLETGSLFQMSHNEQLDEFNQVFANTDSIQEACNILSNEVYCDLAISNLGRFVNDRAKIFNGKFNINELYCTDPLNSNPSIAPAIVIHLVYWRGEIMIEYGANKSCFGSIYFDRYKELLLDEINLKLI